MIDVLGTLVKLFAQYPVAEIENGEDSLVSAFRAGYFDEVKKLPDYKEKYNLVRNAKRRVEKIESQNPDSVGDQALGCLNVLRDLRQESVYRRERYNVLRELVGRSLYQKWPAADQQTFARRVAVFDTWTDFFISYTNRDANATNNRYRALISHHLGWPPRETRESINYVARVIAKILEQKNIYGFVDFKRLQCGDEIPAKVLEHCQATIAFVQLVEEAALAEPPPPAVNWCFREYTAFTDGVLPVVAPAGLGNRCFFALAGATEFAAPPGLGQSYQEWYGRMAPTLHIVLDKCNAKPFDELNSKVREIASQIIEVRKQLFESMLKTWP
jgi:hypothetical protein